MKNSSEKEKYQKYIEEITPKNSLWKDCFRAFISGGLVCMGGQGLTNLFLAQGMDEQQSGAWTMLILIGLAVLLTGLGIFAKLTKWCGAGVLVPITGFANSVAAPAIEQRPEGFVAGVGASIFKISGPVILYGIFSSWFLGLLYWLGKCFGWC